MVSGAFLEVYLMGSERKLWKEEDGVELRCAVEQYELLDYWDILWGRKRFVFIFVIGGIFLGLVLSFLLPKYYVAEIRLIPVESDSKSGVLSSLGGRLGGLASLAGLNLGIGVQKAEAMALLTSRSIVEEFVSAHDLMPVLFQKKWDPVAEKWKSDAEPPSMWDATELFIKKVRLVSEDLDTGVVSLKIRWRNPDLAASWANEYVEMANERLRKRAIHESEQAIDYLNAQLGKVNIAEVRSAIFRLIEEQLKQQVLAKVRLEYAFKIVDPAVAPDSDDFDSPNPVLVTALTTILALSLCIFIIIVQNWKRHLHEPISDQGPN